MRVHSIPRLHSEAPDMGDGAQPIKNRTNKMIFIDIYRAKPSFKHHRLALMISSDEGVA